MRFFVSPASSAIFAFVCSLVFLPGSTRATFLTNPQFFETANCGAGNQETTGLSLSLPESIAIDYTNSNDDQCIVSVLTSAIGPQADVQVSAESGIAANGTARITYFFAVEPRVANAPTTPVSVTTHIVGSASVFGEPAEGTNGSAGAAFEVEIPDPIGSPQSGSRRFSGSAHVADCTTSPLSCPNQPGDGLALAVQLMLPPDTELQVNKFAAASADPRSPGITLDAQAVVDPVFEITPGFVVDYNGTPTPATELYRIRYSAGVTAPAPAGGIPLAAGIAWLGYLVARRRVSRIGREA